MKINSKSHSEQKPKHSINTFINLKTSLDSTNRSVLTISDSSHKNYRNIYFFTSYRSFFHTFNSKPSLPSFEELSNVPIVPNDIHLTRFFNISSKSSVAHGRPRPYVDIFCPPAIVVCYFSMSTSRKTSTAASFVLATCGLIHAALLKWRRKENSAFHHLTERDLKYLNFSPNTSIQPARQLFFVATPRFVLPKNEIKKLITSRFVQKLITLPGAPSVFDVMSFF